MKNEEFVKLLLKKAFWGVFRGLLMSVLASFLLIMALANAVHKDAVSCLIGCVMALFLLWGASWQIVDGFLYVPEEEKKEPPDAT